MMKYVCGILGLLFIFVGNYFPLPDPGLGAAFFVCGASLCLSALSVELIPVLDHMVTASEIASFSTPSLPHATPDPAAAPTPEN